MLWVGVIILLFVVCIPLGVYGYWLWRAIREKKRRRVIVLGLTPIVAVLAFKLGFVWWDKYEEAKYWEGLFSVSTKMADPIFSYHSERAFNGDGYSIEVFALPDVVAKRFLALDGALTKDFPKRPDYRSHWKTFPWRRAPFDVRLNEYLEFAEMGGRGLPGVDVQIARIRTALAHSSTYYAIFYNRPDKGYLGDVDFFLVDLEAGLVYTINFNT